MIIYKATNILNGKSYIGLTTRSLQERKLEHLRHTDIENTYFHRAIKKYGQDNFTWQVIDSASTIEELRQLEIYYIQKLNTLAPNGYNITTGGENPKFENRRDYSYGNNPSAKKIINLTTLQIFDSIKRASKYYNVSNESIRKALNNHSPCCNCLWEYYQEDKEYIKTMPTLQQTSRKQVKNIETGEIFKTISMASQKYHIARKTIRDSCNKVKDGIWEWVY